MNVGPTAVFHRPESAALSEYMKMVNRFLSNVRFVHGQSQSIAFRVAVNSFVHKLDKSTSLRMDLLAIFGMTTAS